MRKKLIVILFFWQICIGFTQNKSIIKINWKTDITELNNNLEPVKKPYFEKLTYVDKGHKIGKPLQFPVQMEVNP